MSDELIAVIKDGEVIRVHPGTLENHKQLGWEVVEKVQKPAKTEEPAASTEASKPGKKGK